MKKDSWPEVERYFAVARFGDRAPHIMHSHILSCRSCRGHRLRSDESSFLVVSLRLISPRIPVTINDDCTLLKNQYGDSHTSRRPGRHSLCPTGLPGQHRRLYQSIVNMQALEGLYEACHPFRHPPPGCRSIKYLLPTITTLPSLRHRITARQMGTPIDQE